jgi:formamidopyrimidine-DNA glycosylase
VEALNKQTVAVVTDALAHGGNSFSNYVQTDGEPGGFYNHMMVYGREGLGCKVCKQKIIIKIKVAGRGTHFCYNCQPKRING